METVSKRKRSKRERLLPPPSTSSAESSGTTTEEYELEEEEADMANCLILLARGRHADDNRSLAGPPNPGPFHVYECKTCSKSFPSFQALGGHRASHKRPKPGPTEKPIADGGGGDEFGSAAVLQLVKKPKVHQCSACGSEFSSGQALGGHMRRHRPATVPEIPSSKILSLDLNLPAPSEEDSPFPAAGKQSILFSASALVNCHY